MPKLNLSARPLNLKLKYPFTISRGSMTQAKNVLVSIRFDDMVAYGEAAPSMYYGEDQSSVIKFIQAFVKHRPIDDYIMNIQKLSDDLTSFNLTQGGFSSSARLATEMAFWDLVGKINNKSLYQFFFQDDPFIKNGNGYKLPQTSFTIGLDNVMVIEEKVNDALARGYNILKIKLGRGYEEDLRILDTIQNVVKDRKCTLRVDANGGWNLETTKRFLDILPKYKVELLEQPLPKGKLNELATILESSPIPIFVDEDCMSGNDVEKIAGKAHGVNIKLMKTGSIIEAFKTINLAKCYKLKVMLGCMIESSCAISAAVHLSPMADYLDLDGHLLLDYDPFSGLILEKNKLVPSFEPGLGVEFADFN